MGRLSRCPSAPYDCIPESYFCDEICDCYNCTDEIDCIYPCNYWENAPYGDPLEGCRTLWYTSENCTSTSFYCNNNESQCVNPSYTCDGYCDCADNCMDEYAPWNCLTPPEGECRPGYSNCYQVEDQYNYKCKPYWSGSSDNSTWTCPISSNRTIPEWWVCDGYCDCLDYCEDECASNCIYRIDNKDAPEKEAAFGELDLNIEELLEEKNAQLASDEEKRKESKGR